MQGLGWVDMENSQLSLRQQRCEVGAKDCHCIPSFITPASLQCRPRPIICLLGGLGRVLWQGQRREQGSRVCSLSSPKGPSIKSLEIISAQLVQDTDDSLGTTDTKNKFRKGLCRRYLGSRAAVLPGKGEKAHPSF